jgi:hypothetical protein
MSSHIKQLSQAILSGLSFLFAYRDWVILE